MLALVSGLVMVSSMFLHSTAKQTCNAASILRCTFCMLTLLLGTLQVLSLSHKLVLKLSPLCCAELQTFSNQELRWLQRHASSSGGL